MLRYYYALLVLLCLAAVSRLALAEDIVSSRCLDFTTADVPVGDFADLQMPMAEMRVTQNYNNSHSEGWCQSGGGQPPAHSQACQGKNIYYGHDGLDLHPQGAKAGEHEILSIQDGLVIASENGNSTKGWGESMILATRPNAYSEEIITFHYHHLFFDRHHDTTSRRFNACETVAAGDVLALEGGTPNWPTHLHLSVKRWANATELLNTLKIYDLAVYGNGYVYGNSSQLIRHLDPQGLLFDYFAEYAVDNAAYPIWQWSWPYARETRRQGWHFGEYDGRFGVDTVVKRREAARLVKVAARIETVTQGWPDYFYDLPPHDADFPYVNTLCRRPVVLPVIGAGNSCTENGHNFCPDRDVTRAEAVKMVVAAFFTSEFLEFYDNWVWRVAAPLASNTLSRFTDVAPHAWYTPYLYVAWQQGLIEETPSRKFYPASPVHRAELAKWLVLAHQKLWGTGEDACRDINCAGGYYCAQASQTCQPLPACVPQDGEACPLGGGYVLPGNADAGPPDSAGNDAGSAGAGGTDAGVSPPDGGAGGSAESGVGGTGGCTVNYYASPSGASCHQNTQSSGSPTLCLELGSPGGGTASWRLCKQSGTFQNQISYQLLDQNHLSHHFGGPFLQDYGASCTVWRNADFSYLTQNGPINGAGLIVEVHSPTGCASPACTYYSGITTVYRQCE